MKDRILLVDDDPTLLRFLGEYLRQNEYTVDTAANGAAAIRQAYQERPDLVILDVMMPGMDGWEVCARLREMSDLPIILLTAKSSEADKLRGFRLGIDDYVVKPFSFAEMEARIRAVLARTRAGRAGRRRVFLIDDLLIDLDKRTVERSGEPVPLTPTEFRLLECLVQKEGAAISESELAQEVWGAYKVDSASAVRRYIWLLRQKIENDPGHPERILTVRGYGYRLATARPAENDLPPLATDAQKT